MLNILTNIISVRLSQLLSIERSESFNYQISGDEPYYIPTNAHDGNYDTWYTVKQGAVKGNVLKLYLSRDYSITELEIVSRSGGKYIERLNNTEARVYSSVNGEVSSCGIITGELSTKEFENAPSPQFIKFSQFSQFYDRGFTTE